MDVNVDGERTRQVDGVAFEFRRGGAARGAELACEHMHGGQIGLFAYIYYHALCGHVDGGCAHLALYREVALDVLYGAYGPDIALIQAQRHIAGSAEVDDLKGVGAHDVRSGGHGVALHVHVVYIGFFREGERYHARKAVGFGRAACSFGLEGQKVGLYARERYVVVDAGAQYQGHCAGYDCFYAVFHRFTIILPPSCQG